MPCGACSGSRLPVAGRLLAQLHVEERVAELVQHVLDLRQLDELPASGGGAVVQCREHRERAGRAGGASMYIVAGVSTIAPSWCPMSWAKPLRPSNCAPNPV